MLHILRELPSRFVNCTFASFSHKLELSLRDNKNKMFSFCDDLLFLIMRLITQKIIFFLFYNSLKIKLIGVIYSFYFRWCFEMRVFLIILVFSAVVHSKDFSFEDVQKVVEKVSNSKFVQQAKKLAAVAGPMYEVITFALDFFTESDSEKFERYFEEIKESLKEIKGKLNNIVSQLSVIESRINTIGLELRQDVRYQSFFTYYAEISSAVNLFETTILNHRGSLGDFKRRLNEFISKYEDNNWEFKLVYFGTTALNTHKSLIDAIIDVSINSENNNENEFISSTQQVVFEFYMSTFMKIYEGGALLKFCYILRQHANGGDY